MSRVVAIVQARMGSTRLPGKVMADIAGKPMLQHVVERLARAARIDEVVVATSIDPQDEPILDAVGRLGFRGVAGSESDVLDRYYHAAQIAQADVIVRVTSDCPLVEPTIVDKTLDLFFAEQVDYAANCIQQTYPRGIETEVFSAASLTDAHRTATLPLEREHVTPHFYLNPDEYRLVFLAAQGELRRPDLRLCVDTEDDLALIRAIFERLGPDNRFPLIDVVRLVDSDAGLRAMNAHIQQKKLGE
ncbi:MAG: glycosyltransferase family protein [Candidatus Hydrogenedentes bacterium]|nr:glycosyltransferase family protein [Candidatus Hydrogenedentota bacterium]